MSGWQGAEIVRVPKEALIDRGSRLRLTLRGRAVAAALLTLVLLLAFSVGRASAGDARATSGAAPPPTTRVWVAPGDTLWSIASSVRPGEDPRDVIADIYRLNDVSSSPLRTGQELVVPVPPSR